MSLDYFSTSTTRDDIDHYVKVLKSNGLQVSGTTMTGREIRAALGLTVTPNLLNKTHKSNFYSMKTDALETIKNEYSKSQQESSNGSNVDNQDSTVQFAKAIVKLKKNQWQNSIDGLPDRNALQQEHILLLWKLDQEFQMTFMNPMSPPRETTPRHKSPEKGSHDIP